MDKPRRRHRLFWAVLVVLALLELDWMRWVLSEPLPNAGNVGGMVRRSLLLWRAFPAVVPGVRFEQSYLGSALIELSHLQFLPQRLPIVLGAALIGGAAVALGRLVLRGLRLIQALDPLERLALSFGLGTTGLGLATLLVGRIGLLSPWLVRLSLGALIASEALRWALKDRRVEKPEHPDFQMTPAGIGLGAIVGPFLLVMALGSMLPTIDFDAIEYHLQGPKEHYQAGRIRFLPHNVYTSMPFGVEMLHLLGMETLNDWWWGALVGQLLVAAYAPLTAILIARTAERFGSPRAGWIAAVVYLTTPWVYRLAVIPYVEGPLCFYHAALVWAAGRAWTTKDDPPPRLWGVVGLLAGGAMACKYPALISAVVPFGLLALVESFRRRSPRMVVAFALGWALVMTPWLAKNVIDTGNPVYPLGYTVFGGRHWDRDLDQKWTKVHGPKPVALQALVDSIVEVAGRSDWQSPLYVALAPLALLRPGSRRGTLTLWGYVAYLFLTWWLLTHRLDRFWLPLLPALAVLAGLGGDWVRARGWTVLLAGLLGLTIVANFTYVSTALAGFNEWTGDLRELRTKVPALLNPSLVRLDAQLGPRDQPLLVGQAAVFHLNHPVVYNTVFNPDVLETLTTDQAPEQVRENLRRHGITHIFLDWHEIERYRSPGNYGFTDYVTPEVFARWVAAGILEQPRTLGPQQEWYRVLSSRREASAWTP